MAGHRHAADRAAPRVAPHVARGGRARPCRGTRCRHARGRHGAVGTRRGPDPAVAVSQPVVLARGPRISPAGALSMCGIAGFIHVNRARAADPRVVERMTRTLVHRGPDEDGYFVEGPVALGMRRLRIIDLEGGRQPISNEDGTVWIVFNGEIYNFPELRRELEGRHRFKTRSGTEVIVHLYEDHGLG